MTPTLSNEQRQNIRENLTYIRDNPNSPTTTSLVNGPAENLARPVAENVKAAKN